MHPAKGFVATGRTNPVLRNCPSTASKLPALGKLRHFAVHSQLEFGKLSIQIEMEADKGVQIDDDATGTALVVNHHEQRLRQFSGHGIPLRQPRANPTQLSPWYSLGGLQPL
jgi:hypothetical protein